MTLKKAQIVEAVAEKIGFTKKRATDTVEIAIEAIKSSLESGQDVLISGFGKFCVKEKNQRKGRNPATGQDMMLRERRVVKFKSSGKLKKEINRTI
ncbi:MAG: integration host factor subunit alpha [Desulfobacterales bacterium]|nr:integration host factor subunit alpha [Deltaproteobacteria bacterium]NNL76608.1 integration host factor subunit alpha [Desulfobacterales bacterium]